MKMDDAFIGRFLLLYDTRCSFFLLIDCQGKWVFLIRSSRTQLHPFLRMSYILSCMISSANVACFDPFQCVVYFSRVESWRV